MIVIKRDNPKVYGGKAYLMTAEEAQAIDAVAESLTIRRGPLVDLLRKHDYKVADDATREEILLHLTNAYRNKNFANDYAQLAIGKTFSNADGEQPKSTGATDPYTGATVSIMNAFASIFNAFQKPDYTGQQLTYNQQILAAAQQMEAQKARNKKIAWIVGGLIIALIIGFTVYYAKKKKAI